MFDIFNIIIFLVFTLLLGLLVWRLICPMSVKPWLWQLAMAYGLGSFIITSQLFIYLFILKLEFSAWLFYSLLCLEIIGLILYLDYKELLAWPRLNMRLEPPKVKIITAIFLLLIAGQTIFLLGNALARPPLAYDSLATWSLRAKLLYFNKIDFARCGLDCWAGGHANYPWHIPLLEYWFNINLGHYDDLLTNLVFVFYYLALLIVTYYTIRQFISRDFSLLFVWLFSSLPFALYHGYNGYADLALGFYALAGFSLLLAWFKTRQNNSLILSGVFLGIACFTKIEGMIFAIAALIALLLNLLVHRSDFKKLKTLLIFSLSLGLTILPWLFFNVKYNLGFTNTEAGLGFHPEIFKKIFFNLFASNNWNIWWFLVPAAIFLNWRKIFNHKDTLVGWTFPLAASIGFLLLYLFTNEYKFVVDNTALSRNLLTLAPLYFTMTAVSFQK